MAINPAVVKALNKTTVGKQVVAAEKKTASSSIKSSSPAGPVKPVAPSKPTSPSSPTMGPAAPRPGETKEQYTERITPPKENYVPPSPGIKAGFENNELVTRVTLRPGEGSNLRWEKTETTPTSQGYELKGYITSPNKTEGIQPARKVGTQNDMNIDFKPETKTSFLDAFNMATTGTTPSSARRASEKGLLTTATPSGTLYAIPKKTQEFGIEVTKQAAISYGLGSVVRVAAPIAATSTGILKGIYTGSKIVGVGAVGVGIGADVVNTKIQYDKGLLSHEQVFGKGVEYFTQFTLFGAGAGAKIPSIRSYREGKLIQQGVKQASLLNIRGGQSPEYGVFKAGRTGELIGSSKLNIRQNILGSGGKIGEQYTIGTEALFSPGKKVNVFLDYPGSKSPFGKNVEMVAVGGSEAVNKIIPSVERPVQTDVFTTMKYRTGELQGVIKTGKILKYTKLTPEYTPYVDNTPWGFKKTPLKFEKASDVININKPKLDLKSNVYTGGAKSIGTTSGGLVLESQRPLSSFEKALLRSEIEQTPVFNVYPPTSRMTARLGPVITPITSVKTTTQTTADYAGVMNKRFTSLGFKTDTKTDRIQKSNRDTSTTKTARARLFGTGFIDILAPRQITRTEQRQQTFKTTKADMAFENMLMNKFSYPRESLMKQPPFIPGFPLMGLTGGGEGGRGSDDWDRYFRKRKFHIGSINQAFGIGMKPMKIKGGKKQWAF